MGGPETGENQRTTAARIYAYMREISQKMIIPTER